MNGLHISPRPSTNLSAFATISRDNTKQGKSLPPWSQPSILASTTSNTPSSAQPLDSRPNPSTSATKHRKADEFEGATRRARVTSASGRGKINQHDLISGSKKRTASPRPNTFDGPGNQDWGTEHSTYLRREGPMPTTRIPKHRMRETLQREGTRPILPFKVCLDAVRDDGFSMYEESRASGGSMRFYNKKDALIRTEKKSTKDTSTRVDSFDSERPSARSKWPATSPKQTAKASSKVPVHYTISKDKTAGEEASLARLLKEYGEKTMNPLSRPRPQPQNSRAPVNNSTTGIPLGNRILWVMDKAKVDRGSALEALENNDYDVGSAYAALVSKRPNDWARDVQATAGFYEKLALFDSVV